MRQLSTPFPFARHSREGGNPDSSLLKFINKLLDTRLGKLLLRCSTTYFHVGVRGYDELGCYKCSMKVQLG